MKRAAIVVLAFFLPDAGRLFSRDASPWYVTAVFLGYPLAGAAIFYALRALGLW